VSVEAISWALNLARFQPIVAGGRRARASLFSVLRLSAWIDVSEFVSLD
jgi:hypothetical protein